ncbi:MAG: thioesterase family protein [Bacteroidota bacterium]
MQDLQLADFPLQSYDKLRYADTDRQGHVNNAVFSTFLETGRVEFLYGTKGIFSEDCSFVVAAIDLKLQAEIKWPGKVDIGTGIARIGNSSMRILQKLFQDGKTVALAETVIVHVRNDGTGSVPLSDQSKEALRKWHLGK